MSICVPPDTDWSCRFTADELEAYKEQEGGAERIERAEAFGWTLLAALTLYRIGTCPITVRPCSARCAPPGAYPVALAGRGVSGGLPVAQIGMLNPFISGGRWYNACGCRGNDCSCTALSEVILPGPVGGVVSVWLDGQEVPRSAWRVDNGNRLVRTDGETWPACQDMSASDEEGFSVTYYRGARPNVMTRAAAGALANEFLLSCEGSACRLPGNVTSASGQGMSYEFAPQDWEGGETGIPEVNAVIRIYNPANLKTGVTVSSPDDSFTRTPTF